MSEEDIQEYVDRLKECKEYDAESGHIEADKILIDFISNLGYESIVEAWNEVEKWYSKMMDLFTLQQQIREHKLLPFYVFTGEEIELQNIYLKQMGNIIRVDNVAQIYNKITSKLISGKFTIYVVRDDMDFIKSEKAWANISKNQRSE